MSKLNHIQTALKEIDGGKFQKLIETYLYKKRGFSNIHAIGSVAGKDKVKTGTPDILFRVSDNAYVFAECTTQQDRVTEKLQEDLDKDLDEGKTGVPVSEIKEILFCLNVNLAVQDEKALVEQCQAKGVPLTIINLDTLSHDLHDRYPGIAKEFLGIEIDTRQIISLAEFVIAYGRSKLAAPLDTAFHFREDEVKKVIAAVEETNVILISGRPGLGKSRLALECCKQFLALHPEYQAKAIHNLGADLYDDIRTYFSPSGHYLILIDDANRLSSLGYFVGLVQSANSDKQIKIIATVRDYALRHVCETFTATETENISIQPFEDKQIQQLVKDQYQINNPIYLERICKIAEGNPRLAIMAARVAVEKNKLSSISDVSELFDKYFATIRGDLNALGDAHLLKVAAIVAFFRKIDRTQDEFMASIKSAFGITPDEFWKGVMQLHEMEIFDVHEDEIVGVSDQVLATYLFYLACFKDSVLSFETFLEHFFPNHSQRLRDALYGVLNAFSLPKISSVLSRQVDRYWKSVEARHDEALLLNVMETFWFIRQTETLLFIKKKVSEMEADTSTTEQNEEQTGQDASEAPPILKILGHFSQTDDANMQTALDLLYDYAAKKPSMSGHVRSVLLKSFGFERDSHMRAYEVQTALAESLWKRTIEGSNETFSRLFLVVADYLLGTQFTETEASRGMSITMFQFSLPASKPILELRKFVWEKSFSLNNRFDFKTKVEELIPVWGNSKYYRTEKTIITEDAVYILPFLQAKLNPEDYQHCQLVDGYLALLEGMEVPYPPEMKSWCKNPNFNLFNILDVDSDIRRALHLDYHEAEKLRIQQIHDHLRDLDLDGLKGFLAQCAELAKCVKSSDTYKLNQSMSDAFAYIEERSPKLFVQVLEHYIQIGEPLQLRPFEFAAALIRILGHAEAHGFIWSRSLSNAWKFGYYWNLPEEAVTTEHLSELYTLIESAKLSELPGSLDFLFKFLHLDDKVFTRIAARVLDKEATGDEPHSSLAHMLLSGSRVAKNVEQIFSPDIPLLKRIYFHAQEKGRHFDYDGFFFSKLLQMDPTFLGDYIDWVYRGDKIPGRHDDTQKYSALWLRKDYPELISFVLARIDQHLGDKPFRHYSYDLYALCFFSIHSGKDADLILARQNEFLLDQIRTRAHDLDFMRYLFTIISEFGDDRRLPFIKAFLETNPSFAVFQTIPLLPNHWGGSGSMVPVIQKRNDFLNSVLDLLQQPAFLEHRARVEEDIRHHDGWIEREKRNNFLRDF